MKSKSVYTAILLFVMMSGVCTSCHKDSDTNPLPVGHIARLQHQLICPSIGGFYHLDLDGDGIADLALRLSSYEADQTECQDCYYSQDFDVGCDSILNNKIYLSSQTGLGNGMRYYLGDSVQFSNIVNQTSSINYGLMTGWSKQTCTYTFYGVDCDTSVQYFGFEKVDAGGTKYGWFALQYDNHFNVYLDGVYMSAVYGQHIKAGFDE